jgi:membrane dipeptidase
MGNNTASLTERTAEVHQYVLTIDSHADTPLRFIHDNYNFCDRHQVETDGSCVDVPRMREGHLDAIFLAAFISQRERSPEGYRWARERVLTLIDRTLFQVNQCSTMASFATSPDDIFESVKTNKHAVLLGVENGFAIGRDLEMIRELSRLGVSYMTLCHTKNNDICDSSTDPEGPEHGGLSEYGRRVVKELNRTGIMIDVSHVSDQSFYDVVEESRAPVIASHSCVRALCDHPRNMNDLMIETLADAGGVIQVCLLSAYVKTLPGNPDRQKALEDLRKSYGEYGEMSETLKRQYHQDRLEIDRTFPPRRATVSDLVDHIDHIVDLVGIDYVGIGSDFDGGGGLADCRDVRQLSNITRELLKRGYSDRDIQKLWGENLLRVFRQARHVASERFYTSLEFEYDRR